MADMEEVAAKCKGKQFIESSLDEDGNLVITFNSLGESAEENTVLTVSGVAEEDITCTP